MMAANQGFNETLTVPQNHKDSTASSVKSLDTHFRTINTGIISVAKNLGIMHNNISELDKSTKGLLTIRDRIDLLEKTLITHSKMLSDIVESVHRQEALLKLTDRQSSTTVPAPVKATLKVPAKTSESTKRVVSKLKPIVKEETPDLLDEPTAPVPASTPLVEEPVAEPVVERTSQPIMLSAPVVEEMSTVNANATVPLVPTIASVADVAENNEDDDETEAETSVPADDDIEISESEEEEPKPKPKAKPEPAKKKPVAKPVIKRTVSRK